MGKITSTLKSAAMLAAGGIGAKVLSSKLSMVKDERLRAAVPILLGAMLAGKKGTRDIGTGMMTVGATELASKLIPGINGLFDGPDDVMSGMYDEVIAGDATGTLNGYQDQILSGINDDIVA